MVGGVEPEAREARLAAKSEIERIEVEAYEVESLAHCLQQGVRDAYAAYAKRKYWNPSSGE